MINWFKNETFVDYRVRLRQSFPARLRDDLEIVLNILPFDSNEVKLHDGQFYKLKDLIHPTTTSVTVDNEQLIIPNRLYFNEPTIDKEGKLTVNQKTILNCIFLRHHDGYLRQRRLEKLIDKHEYFITPFTIQLLGEYVFEITETLDKHIRDNRVDNYKKFVQENPDYWRRTESRMISYWNEYYRRRFPNLRDYLGHNIVDRIGKNKYKQKVE